MAEPVTYEQMRDLLREQAGLIRGSGTQPSSGSAPSGGSGGGSAPGWMNTMATGASNVTGAAAKMATGLYGATDALGNIKQLGGFLGPVGKTFTEVGGQVAEAGLAVNKSLNTVAQNGVHMGQNLGLYDKAVLEARMSLPEFEQTIKANSRSLAGLGPNMDKSALIFLNTAKQIQDTDMAYALKATGVQSEEFGQILALVAHNSKQDNLMSATAQKNLIATSIALATEFDNTARLTGISRQEQQKALEGQLKSKEMQLAMASMSAEERSAIEKSLAGTTKYGEAVQNAIKIYATGGVTNEEEQKQVLAAGPLAKYAEQLANIKGTSPEDEKKRQAIYAQMDQVAMEVAQNGRSQKEWMIQAKAGSDTTKAMASGQLEILRWGQVVAKADAEAKAKGITREQYLEQERKKLADERTGAAAGTGGPEGKEAQLGQTLNKMDTAIKDVTAGAGTYFSKLNSKIGDTIQGFDGFNKYLRRYTPEQLASVPGKAVSAAKEKLGVKEAKVPEKEAKRQDGSFGAVGKLIEDFGAGTHAILHGKEGVITEKQLQGIVGAAQEMGKKFGNSTTKLSKEKEIEQAIAQFGNLGPDLSKMQKQFEPIMSQAQANAAVASKSLEKQMGPMLNSIKGGLKTDLEKAKSQMPTTNTFEKMFEQIKPPTSAPAPEIPAASMPESSGSDPMTEMVKGVNDLNKRIERLISAVEDGHDKSVRAIKNTGNLIA